MLNVEQFCHLIYLVESHISFIAHTGDNACIEKDKVLLEELKNQYKHQLRREDFDKKHFKYIFDIYKTEENLGKPLFEKGYCKEAPNSCPYLKYIGENGLEKSVWACRKYGKEIHGNIFNMPAQRTKCEEEFGDIKATPK